MLAFTNNSGPLFIIGTAGNIFFGNSAIGILLFITHILSAISVGIVYGLASKHCTKLEKFSKHTNLNFIHTQKLQAVPSYSSVEKKQSLKSSNSQSNLGEILTTSISKSITSILQIGGFIVLFSVIHSILNRLNIISGICNLLSLFNIPNNYSNGFICGILELTNGINLISSIHTKTISYSILISSFLLGFGGFCIALQVLSISSKYNLSVKKYFLGKMLQGIFSILYAALFIRKCPFFNFDLPTSTTLSGLNQNVIWIAFSVLIVSIFTIFIEQKKSSNT